MRGDADVISSSTVPFSDLNSIHEKASPEANKRTPRKPTNVAVVPGNADRDSCTEYNCFTISSTNQPESGKSITTFEMQASKNGRTEWATVSYFPVPVTFTRYEHDLGAGTTLYFRVRTEDSDGWGPWSDPVSGTNKATPPGEVSSLMVTSVSPSIINLSWTAPTNDGGSQVTGYRVDIRTVTPQAYVRLDETTSTSYRVTGLNHSTQYRILVRAVNNTGAGIQTAITSTTTAATRPDAAPRLTATATGRTSIDISWTLPVETGGIPITAGQIGVSRNGTTDDGFIGVSPGALSATDKGLQPNTIYYYRIRFQNSEGVSPWSDYVSATTDAVSTPGAPTGLTAAASGLNSHVLTWTAPDDDGGAVITNYQVEESNTGTGTWSVLIPAMFGSAVPRFSRPVSPGTVTYYRVRAHNLIGTGPPSDAVRTTTKVATVPAAPTGLTAAADGPSVITLRWTVPSDNGGAAITGYRIESFRLGGGLWTEVTPNTQSTATTYMHTGLTANTKLHYRVSAINTAGTGGASSSVSATTTAATAPAAPTDLTATADGQTTINLSWTVPTNTGGVAITGYLIEVSTDGGSTFDPLVPSHSTTSYSHTGLTAGTTRHYRVSAINNVDTSTPSDVAMATTAAVITAPGAPTSLTATASGQTTINLSWTAPESTGGTSITGYLIEVSTDGGSTFNPLVPSHSTTSYSHTGLTAGTMRHYRVSAINNVDTSTPSNVAMATTIAVATATAPGAPTSLTATASGPTTINLSWTAPTSTGGVAISGYKIEVSTDGGGTFTELVASHPTPPYAHTGLTAATTRHYRVSAINSVNTGPASNVVTATTADALNPTAPGAPTFLTATASGQTIINLRWTAPSSNGGGRITGYQIEVSTDGGNTFDSPPLVASHPTTSYSHTGLAAGSTRYYRVRAINSAGSGTASNVANATTASDDGGGGGDGGGDGDDDDATAPALTFASASASVDEAAGTYPISVTLSASSSTATTLSYTLSGTATQGTDYTIQSSVTLPANATSAQIPIVIVDDQEEEFDETIIVTLTSNAGYELGTTTIFTLTITDNDTTTLSFTQTIANQSYSVGLSITDLMLPEAQQGTPIYVYTLTPELPKGLTFDATTRVLSGTPTEAAPAKTYTYTATDASANSATLTFTIEVVQADKLTFTETVGDQRVPAERLVKNFIFPVATGGVAPYTYTLRPELPDGIMFDSDTRTLSGTPSGIAAAKTYTYRAEDQAGKSVDLNFSLEVYQISFPDRIADQSYPQGAPIAALILPEVTSGVPPINYTLTLLDLPLGLRFDLSTRSISGTPTEVTPPVTLTYTATDANGAAESLMFTIEVVSPVNTEVDSGLPQAFRVYPNYPNPFYRSTHLVFDLPWPAQVQVEVLDVLGRRMATPQEVHLSAGWRHELELSDLGLPAGPYLYQLQATSLEDHSSSVYVGHFISVQ